MKRRTEEQIESVAELTDSEIADLRRLQALDGETETEKEFRPMDSITVDSCWQNGRDTCVDLGITERNGFTWCEVETATARHAVNTARFYEVV